MHTPLLSGKRNQSTRQSRYKRYPSRHVANMPLSLLGIKPRNGEPSLRDTAAPGFRTTPQPVFSVSGATPKPTPQADRWRSDGTVQLPRHRAHGTTAGPAAWSEQDGSTLPRTDMSLKPEPIACLLQLQYARSGS